MPDGYPAPLPEVRVGNVVGSINQVKSKKVLLKIKVLGSFYRFLGFNHLIKKELVAIA